MVSADDPEIRQAPPLSLEIFSPRFDAGLHVLDQRLSQLASVKPTLVSVGGEPTSALELALRVQRTYGLRVQLQLDNGVPRSTLCALLQQAEVGGLSELLLLPSSRKVEGGFGSLREMVEVVTTDFPSFTVSVTGFPRGTKGEVGVYSQDVSATAAQVAAGATAVICSPIFDINHYVQYVGDLRSAGVPKELPVQPSLLPLSAFGSRAEVSRVMRRLGWKLPTKVASTLEALEGDGSGAALEAAGEWLFVCLFLELVRRCPNVTPHVVTLNAAAAIAALRAVNAVPTDTKASEAAAASAPAPDGARLRFIVSDGEAASAISALLADRLLLHATASPVSMATVTVDALRHCDETDDGAALLFVVECDADGSVGSDVRQLTRALTTEAATAPLQGSRVAVLALAKSTCAFSAAAGGDQKFLGGAKLLSALRAAGAEDILQLGRVEVELEDLDASVLPWGRRLIEAVAAQQSATSAAAEALSGLAVVSAPTTATSSIGTLHVLYGGKLALEIAEIVGKGAIARGYAVALTSMGDFKQWIQDTQLMSEDENAAPLFVIFMVETVENEQPAEDAGGCVRFFNRRTHPASSLRRLRYTVLGLGDSNLLLDRQTTTAADCNQVAQRLDKRLGELGAAAFACRGEADDRTGNKEVQPWIDALWGALEAMPGMGGDA